MANPLTLYVPIKTDDKTQKSANDVYALFPALVGPGLDALRIVHFARLALIKAKNDKGVEYVDAVMLITEFDGSMDTYLKAFWEKAPGIKAAFTGLMGLARIPVKDYDPKNVTYPQFFAFIDGNNLNKPSDNYSAYKKTVDEILGDD